MALGNGIITDGLGLGVGEGEGLPIGTGMGRTGKGMGATGDWAQATWESRGWMGDTARVVAKTKAPKRRSRD